MNSHFQSSETTWTSTGCLRAPTSGLRAGIELVRADPGHAAEQDDHQAGIDQTTSSMAPEYSQSGR